MGSLIVAFGGQRVQVVFDSLADVPLTPRMLMGLVLYAAVSTAIAGCATPRPPRETRQPPTIQLVPCRVPRSSDDVLCGTYAVFEDRAAQAGRRIPLAIVVLPAVGRAPVADPVFVLVGGPGLGAASLVRGDSEWFSDKFRRERDIVFVDQRGTGSSNRLSCRFGDGDARQDAFHDLFPVDRGRACRERLERVADLRLYTTPIAMDDLDDVRAALGYPRINLYGMSYGTQAALQYLRQHPAHVRSVVAAGVATPAAKQPLSFAKAADHAMSALFEDCAADAACSGAFPNLKAEFEAVLATLDKGPATFELPHAGSKMKEPVSMSRGVFVERLRLMLYDLEGASRVPFVIHRAAQEDWVPFATASPVGVTSGVSAMYLTVTCSETAARITEEDIVRETRVTFVGEYRTRTHLRACQEWPRGDVPPEYYDPVASDVPVLMLSGELDAATPAHFASEAARSLSNSRQIVIRNAAHAYWYDCMQSLVSDFFARRSARDLDTTCLQRLRRPPFVTELSALSPP
jgi:pimeloyl-ACP methyl ester carboxylesterase